MVSRYGIGGVWRTGTSATTPAPKRRPGLARERKYTARELQSRRDKDRAPVFPWGGATPCDARLARGVASGTGAREHARVTRLPSCYRQETLLGPRFQVRQVLKFGVPRRPWCSPRCRSVRPCWMPSTLGRRSMAPLRHDRNFCPAPGPFFLLLPIGGMGGWRRSAPLRSASLCVTNGARRPIRLCLQLHANKCGRHGATVRPALLPPYIRQG